MSGPGSRHYMVTEVRVAGQSTMRPALEVETPLLVLGLFEGTTELRSSVGLVNEALGGVIERLIKSGEITGKLGTVHVIENAVGRQRGGPAAERFAIVGLGKPDEFGPEAIGSASAAAARKARELRVSSYATVTHGAGFGGQGPTDAARVVTEASLLALHSDEPSETDRPHRVKLIQLIERDPEKAARMQPGIERGIQAAEAALQARAVSGT